MDERLTGLVALLQAVGVDSSEMAAVSSNLKGGNAPAQLNDQQIEVIIRKLQQAQSEAPQIIAALEAHAESRSQGSGNRQEQKQAEQSHTEEEEEEDSDEEDDDANYPMVGAGISDDISVVSDLTTPTVCNAPVPDEEHYHETLPPMIVGGGAAPPMMINPSKKKNLLNQVRPTGHIAPPSTRRNVPAVSRNGSGGASAKRRPTHSKVDGLPSSSTSRRPDGGVVKKPSTTRPSSSKVISSDRSSSSGEKKKKKKPSSRPPPERQQQHNFDGGGLNRWENKTMNHRGNPRDHNWNAFGASPQQSSNSPRKSKNSPAKPTVIDNDGFLVGESFDPFADADNNPFQHQHSSPAGDLAFGAFDGGNNHHHQHSYHESPRRKAQPQESPRVGGLRPAEHDTRRSTRPKPLSHQQQMMMQQQQQQQQQQFRSDPRSMQSNFSSKPVLRSKAPDAASGGRRRARRASLAM